MLEKSIELDPDSALALAYLGGRATVHAQSDGRLLVLSGKVIARWLRSHPEIGDLLSEALGAEISISPGSLERKGTVRRRDGRSVAVSATKR